jgi:hypothetical protein
MCDAIGAVAVSEYKSMAERQLPAYCIGVQIHPWTFADFYVLIVSNLAAKTADRNEIIHSALPRAWGPILDECPTCRLSPSRNLANRLKRLLLSSDKSLVPQPNAIPNDHQVDDFATGDTSQRTRTVMPAAARPIEEVHRTHEAMATMTTHPILAPVKTGILLSCGMISLALDRCSFTVCHTRPLIPSPRSVPTGVPHRSARTQPASPENCDPPGGTQSASGLGWLHPPT